MTDYGWINRVSLGLKKASVVVTVCLVYDHVGAQPLNSAYFVVNNDDQVGGEFTGCRMAGTPLDSIPMVVAWEVADPGNSLLTASNFAVVRSDGTVVSPVCASLRPSDEENENRTIVLLGEFGEPTISEPKEVRVVGSIELEAIDPTTVAIWDLIGQSIAITGYAAGPKPAVAEILPVGERADTGGPFECGSDANTVVQLTFQAGIRPPPGASVFDPTDFVVTFTDGTTAIPSSFGDLPGGGDPDAELYQDNVLELCLAPSKTPYSVSISGGAVVDVELDANTAASLGVTLSDPPSGLTARSEKCYAVHSVSWSALPGATQYRLWRASSPVGPYSQVYTTTLANANYSSGQFGYYRIQGCNSFGCSGLSAMVSYTTYWSGCM